LRQVRLLTSPEIRALIGPEQALEEVTKAFAALGRGEASLPGVINLEVGEGEVHVKGAHLHGSPLYTIKMASGFPGNARLGLPVGDGMMLAFDAETGALRALLLDNGYLTELRTGSAGALAARLLARPRVARLGILGAGVQARYQLEAFLLVRKPDEVAVYSRTTARAEACAEEMASRFRLSVRAVRSAEDAVRGSDAVITTTPARSPIVAADWVAPGTHVTAMGSDSPEKNELEPALLARADKVVPDRLAQCLALGEIHHACAAGAFSKEAVHAELGAVAAGRASGREGEAEITIADLTGVGVQDAAVAARVVRDAEAAGRGEILTLGRGD
jgi:ornithine cyclodeaminase